MPPLSPTTGGLILQAAQSIISQDNQRKQLELQEKQLKQATSRQDQLFAIREKELKAKEAFNATQQEFAVLKGQQAEAEIEKTRQQTATSRALELQRLREPTSAGGPRALTLSSIQKLRKSMQSTAENQALFNIAKDLNIELSASDNIDVLRAQRTSLMRMVNVPLFRNTDPQQGKGLDDQIGQLDRILKDPRLVSVSSDFQNNTVSQETMARAAKSLFGEGLSDEQAAQLGVELLDDTSTFSAQKVRNFGRLSDDEVLRMGNEAISGNPDELAGVLTSRFGGVSGPDFQKRFREMQEVYSELGMSNEDLAKLSRNMLDALGR